MRAPLRSLASMTRVEGLEGAGDDRAAHDLEMGGPVSVVVDGERGRQVPLVGHQREPRVDDVQVRVEERCRLVGHPWTTSLRSVPTPGILHSATSPGRTWIAPGVPGERMSPG